MVISSPSGPGLFRYEPDEHRTSHDPESRETILIRKIRALNLADILHLRKRTTVLLHALNQETRLYSFHLAGPLSKKTQTQLLLTTQNGVPEEYSAR